MLHFLFLLPLHIFNVYFKDEIYTFSATVETLKLQQNYLAKTPWHYQYVYHNKISRLNLNSAWISPQGVFMEGPISGTQKKLTNGLLVVCYQFFKASRPYSKVPILVYNV